LCCSCLIESAVRHCPLASRPRLRKGPSSTGPLQARNHLLWCLGSTSETSYQTRLDPFRPHTTTTQLGYFFPHPPLIVPRKVRHSLDPYLWGNCWVAVSFHGRWSSYTNPPTPITRHHSAHQALKSVDPPHQQPLNRSASIFQSLNTPKPYRRQPPQ
jgi:hypothetical protein